MAPPPATHDLHGRIEEIAKAAAEKARIMPTRSEVHDLKTQIALLIQRIDILIEERDRAYREASQRYADMDGRLRSLELQGASIKTWGTVAGAIWSLLLTFISLKLWSGQ